MDQGKENMSVVSWANVKYAPKEIDNVYSVSMLSDCAKVAI